MALFSLLRRSLLPCLLSVTLTTCSADGLVPPAPVDHGTRVGAIRPPQRVASMEPTARQTGYPVETAPVARSAQPVDYLNTPNLAAMGTGQPVPQGAGLPGQSQTWGGVQPLAVPEGGVNMDAELGAEPVTGLAQEEQADIAEGQSEQPVVDGIGTDSPTPRRAEPRPRLPPPVAATELKSGATWSDGRPIVAPARVPEENEVAMLRPSNPMMSQPALPPDPSSMPASELSCRRELKRMGVVFTDKPAISNGPSCQVPYPISLQGLSGDIGVKPAVTLNCQVTLAFAKWVKNELAPSARWRYWTGIRTIVPLGGYSCRRMNNSRQRYNPMSEHAKGNAIDVGKFVLKDGHEIDVRKKGLFSFREGKMLKAVRQDSCRYFNTVLGPGSNPEHWNHFHFDLRSRGSGRVYCS